MDISQSADKQENPIIIHSCAGLITQMIIDALKQRRLFQNSSTLCFSFLQIIASDMHLEPQSEERMRNVDFLATKNVQKQNTFLSTFRALLLT